MHFKFWNFRYVLLKHLILRVLLILILGIDFRENSWARFWCFRWDYLNPWSLIESLAYWRRWDFRLLCIILILLRLPEHILNKFLIQLCISIFRVHLKICKRQFTSSTSVTLCFLTILLLMIILLINLIFISLLWWQEILFLIFRISHSLLTVCILFFITLQNLSYFLLFSCIVKTLRLMNRI
jgi:hypothetical protein